MWTSGRGASRCGPRLNEFLQKGQTHSGDGVLTCLRNRKQLFVGLDTPAAIEIEFFLQMAGASGGMRLTSSSLNTLLPLPTS